MLANLSIKARMTWAIAMSCFMLALIGFIGLARIDASNNSLESVYKDRLLPADQLARIHALLQDATRQLMLASMHDPVSDISKLHDHPIGMHLEKSTQALARIEEIWKAYLATSLTPEEKVLAEEFTKKRSALVEDGIKPAMVSFQNAAYHDGVTILIKRVNPLYTDALGTYEKLFKLQIDVAKQLYESAEKTYHNTVILFTVLIVLGTLLAAGVGYWMIRSLFAQLGGEPRYVAAIVNRVAQGDLGTTVELRANDSSSALHALKGMVAKLSGIIGEVHAASDNLNSAAAQISATAQSLSQASSEQAASVEEMTSSVEEMSASISQNAQNSGATREMADNAALAANQGGSAVKGTVEAMRQIADKIGIVDDIAYQTNMLALNAAIEAARAGEHGKGFAVVAAEVRKLAERSQVAAQEIGELASSSVGTAERAGALLDEIVPSITKTSDLVRDIASASDEQSAGVGQINAAMGQLNQITQQNASASEQLAATAEEMGAQAGQLQSLMRFFSLGGNASGSAEKTVQRARATPPTARSTLSNRALGEFVRI